MCSKLCWKRCVRINRAGNVLISNEHVSASQTAETSIRNGNYSILKILNGSFLNKNRVAQVVSEAPWIINAGGRLTMPGRPSCDPETIWSRVFSVLALEFFIPPLLHIWGASNAVVVSWLSASVYLSANFMNNERNPDLLFMQNLQPNINPWQLQWPYVLCYLSAANSSNKRANLIAIEEWRLALGFPGAADIYWRG